MYLSDYTYSYALGVDNTCYTDEYSCKTINAKKGWIYNTNSNFLQWLLSPRSDDSVSAFTIGSEGPVGNYCSDYSYGVRPNLYLVSSIKIDSGDETKQNPYRLKL